MPARRKGGFTLIELLVVIAIIAILAAILFPVFARAREAARKSNCQSNLKECAIALHTYWNDYDATLPSSGITSYAMNGGNYSAADDYYVTFATTVGTMPPPAGPRRTWAQIMYDHLKNKDIMYCPSDSGGNRTTGDTVSYWWKWAADKAWRDTTIACQKEGDFGFNSDQVILFERLGWHSGDTSMGLQNNASINVAFLDTHVKTIVIKNCPTKYDSGKIPATTPSATAGEPFYYNYDNDPNTPAASQITLTTATAADKWDPRRYSDSF